MPDPQMSAAQPPEVEPVPPTKPNIHITVTRGGMEAEVLLQRTSPDTLNPTMKDFLLALAQAGVTTGIKEYLLRGLCAQPLYNQSIVLASGKKPTEGQDGALRYLIRTDRTLRPAIRQDGTADYKDLGFINSVRQGQRLVEVIPPKVGEDGIDVLGTVLPGISGKGQPSPQGAGTELTEDGRFLIASVAGHAEIKRGVVSVREVLKVGNVDNSTGDIVFPGDVIIQGDIAAGFRVVSQNGGIRVRGTVDAATLDAAGDITISEGINGQDRGAITAGGSIKCRYLQNCYIRAEGNIYADTVMYCTLECDGDVELTGKRGQLIGGRSYVAGILSAKGIGTEAHTATKIKMCAASMAQKRELDELEQTLKRIDGEITKIVQLLNRFDELHKQNRLSPDHAETIASVKASYLTLSQQRKETTDQIELLKKKQLDTGAQVSYIKCAGRVHTGVSLTFGPLKMNVQEGFVNSRIAVIDGEIRITPN